MTRSLFRQVYLHGLALLFLVAVALATAGLFLGRENWRGSPNRLARHVGGLLADAPDAALPALAARLSEELDVSLAVHTEDGRTLARVGRRPPSVPDPGERPRHPGHFRRFGAAAPAGPGRTVRLLLDPLEGEWMPRVFGTLALVVAVVALVAAPLARAIARPIERLSEAARRLGEGDLSARSGLDGKGEIGALGRSFDEMAARLERLLAAHRQLLADVSHELRTPLARLRVSMALAADASTGNAARRHVQAAEEDLVELETLVADLLTASRLDSGGRLVLRREEIDLRPLAEAAAERLRRLYPGRSLDLSLATAPKVAAERALLARVLDNLLDNAARYAEGPIGLALGPGEGGALLEVRDQGPGLAPEEQARVFTPFYRSDASRARHTGGAGLGLFLCRRIVEAHDGRITLESRPDAGTRVRVWLPASAAGALTPDGPGAGRP